MMDANRRRSLLIGVAILAFVGVILTVGLALPPFLSWIDGIHPRNVTRALASWEQEFREVDDLARAKRNIEMIEYVKGHYTYEDLPEYRDTEIAKVLADQRARTLQSMTAGLQRFSGQDFGTDTEAWRKWLARQGQVAAE